MDDQQDDVYGAFGKVLGYAGLSILAILCAAVVIGLVIS